MNREEIDSRLDAKAVAWLDQALAEAAEAAGAPDNVAAPTWELRFAAAGRHVGQQNADAVRALLLRHAAADVATLTRLYQRGAAAERRAVLLALPDRVPGPGALPLIEDALRTNDTTLVEAAVGPYAAGHLDPHAWRHAVLKCLFTGVPVAAVADAERRARGDLELARMLADYASERTAAGRSVPDDLHRVMNMTGEES
ncbi:EboA domain-containing protein [Streptomyces sp. NBC_01498]|uniref:EboA domain-containing protein n=1 Tax=Streptomyces sp. NBC_01498 TaxID=2975870 RepID=UPI002E7BFF11|nr:EboA domain-containing protein [Streptomyces sp. NBC_01498]WTL23741.1 EboA domain-containing protein [Streptomyces sp. NBC_01498]